MGQEISILKEAREIYRAQPKTPLTEFLRRGADETQEAYDLLKVSPTRAHIKNFIGLSTLLLVAIAAVTGASPEPPQKGAGEVPATPVTVDKKLARG
jgi:hypothetical protein